MTLLAIGILVVFFISASVFDFGKYGKYRRDPATGAVIELPGAMVRSPSGYTASLPPCHSLSGCFSPSAAPLAAEESADPARSAERHHARHVPLIALGFVFSCSTRQFRSNAKVTRAARPPQCAAPSRWFRATDP
jgi:hypothetical protein